MDACLACKEINAPSPTDFCNECLAIRDRFVVAMLPSIPVDVLLRGQALGHRSHDQIASTLYEFADSLVIARFGDGEYDGEQETTPTAAKGGA